MAELSYEISRSDTFVQLSASISYITSPTYDGLHIGYPNNYRGIFHLDCAMNQSLFIHFVAFTLEDPSHRGICNDFLLFTVGSNGTYWKKCGSQWLLPQVYRYPVSIELVSDFSVETVGFKMMYSVLSRQQEPQQASEGIYNCSVPHFEAFALVLRCNMVVECVVGEDERDCDLQSEECGPGLIDAGTKCYRVLRGQPGISWRNAYLTCPQYGENLVTLATPEEKDIFVRIMTIIKRRGCVYVGVMLSPGTEWSPLLALLYKRVFRWVDGRSAFSVDARGYFGALPLCLVFKPFVKVGETNYFQLKSCTVNEKMVKTNVCDFLCEKGKNEQPDVKHVTVSQSSKISNVKANWNVSMVRCPGGHVTRDFLSCDTESDCGVTEYVTSCQTGESEKYVPMFVCEPSKATIHYSLVCDHLQQCPDKSDEDFCSFQSCLANSMKCRNGQCLSITQICDGKPDCVDFSDEESCSLRDVTAEIGAPLEAQSEPPPFIVNVTGDGRYTLIPINSSSDCPATHFSCFTSVCLPVYLRCNNVDDCVSREDELECESYSCPGFYRCLGSKMCLHPNNVCDGMRQCPQQDDEVLCNPHCPDVCQCQGLAFVCSGTFNASFYPDVRLLDVRRTGLTLGDFSMNRFLVYLDLSSCEIVHIQKTTLPNLRHLDLSWNQLSYIDMAHFIVLQNLRVLFLTGNPLLEMMSSDNATLSMTLQYLHTVDLSRTHFKVFNGTVFSACPGLKSINMSWSQVTTIAGFQNKLESLDMRNSPLAIFPYNLLRNMTTLRTVYTDNFKLCCRLMLPEGFDMKNCHAKPDILASCEDLLKSNAYRVFLWAFAALSILGNVGSCVARIYLDGHGSRLGSFGVFVTNLTLADLFMGVYLAVVGTADLVYHGRYLFHDVQWKNSIVCKSAGFLSLLSSEVSAFNICLITLDRFLVLRFPFSRVHFSRRSGFVACGILWTAGVILALVPVLPAMSHWQFFSQTGICIPLPFISSARFAGYTYSFSVMIVLNFIIFLVIVCGQGAIYWSVRANSLVSANRDATARDTTIARRLTTVVVSDFLCWFPIGLLGVLASTGTRMSDELNVAMAIFVLPINSALNPFLYTLNVLMEKRQKAWETSLLQKLQNKNINIMHAQ